ncbi:MAG: pilus assembly protein PilM [Clostridiaceae bacterium]|nr:pilus assembly protein PilM [Clostridiaceae bacterium]MBW4859852.1 pilus assembly protein PilM [Clostridiaceae bacterium]MBW4869718.1 pilus assembly protein PilM [Clostridiaceae bacterium]
MNIKRFFLPKKVLSIDIGTYETKVVEGKRTNEGLDINKSFSFLTPEGAYEDGYILENELLHYVFKKKFSKNKLSSNIAYITIKSNSIIKKEIELPSVSHNEIKGILKYETKEYLPIEIDNFIIQYKIINKIKKGDIEKLNVLLVAVPKKIVESHFIFLKDLGLKPTVLDLQLNSSSKLFKYNSVVNGEYNIENNTFAIIDLSYLSTGVIIIKNRDILLNENIPDSIQLPKQVLNRGRRNIPDINNLIEEISLVFQNYKTKYVEDQIEMIFLYGGLSNIEDIDLIFENNFNIPSVIVKSMDKTYLSEDLNKYINCIGSIIRVEG